MQIQEILFINKTSNHFELFQNKLFVITENTFVIYDIKSLQLLFSGKSGNAVSLCLFDDFVITQSIEDNSTIAFDCNTLEPSGQFNILSEIYYEIKQNRSDREYFYPLLILKNETQFGKVKRNKQIELVEKFPVTYGGNGIWAIYGESFFSYKEALFGCYFLNNGVRKWQLDLVKIYKEESLSISSFLLFKNRVFILCSSQYDAFTVCVDAESGEVIKRMDEVKFGLKHFNNLLYYKHKMGMLGRLNPATFEIDILNFESVLMPKEIAILSSMFYKTKDGLLIFVDGAGRPTNRFCILNIGSGKLLHVEEFAAEIVIRELRVQGNRIMVRTSDNSLHIYEIR